MKLTLTFAAVAAVATLMAAPAGAQALNRKALSLAMARTLADTAVASCLAKGHAVSAVVVDAAGQTIVALRGDNSSPHTLENARRKAYTAMSFKMPTAAYAKRFADNDPTVRQQVSLPNVIAIGGGLPIKIGNEIVGGAGVSGSPGVDEPCVQDGIDKIADQLK